ncbi:hypothetical protein CAMGR0001_0303 [Campylobacter gracilis RM3268]|uniref:Uncharacterized protein n=1 Tax=Campylobacter gracilis RM3268 TaxID=553220 RepID=C8PKT0_9BACT|nr:hypothetical protein CAMGR0001_0303 [Campylobacter gracilis RM3268]
MTQDRPLFFILASSARSILGAENLNLNGLSAGRIKRIKFSRRIRAAAFLTA